MIWKTLKEQSKLALPTAIAALIGFIIAKVRQTTKAIEAETEKPAPQPPRRRRARRRRR